LTPPRLAASGEPGAAGGWVHPVASAQRSAVAAGIAERILSSNGYGATALHRQPSLGSRTSSDFGDVVELAVTFRVVLPRLKFVV
jgi:hypothetical protein